MADLIDKIPPFWQGVIGSILSTFILLIASKIFSLFSNEIKRSKSDRQKKIEDLRNKVLSQDSVLRVEGYFQVLFTLLQWLFIANISWVISGILDFDIIPYTVSITISLTCFYIGLREIFVLYKILKKDTILMKQSSSQGKFQIHFGEYGYGDKYSDVTKLLLQKVREEKLEINAINEEFGDAHPGVVKHLNVIYSYDGTTHKRSVQEGETLSIP